MVREEAKVLLLKNSMKKREDQGHQMKQTGRGRSLIETTSNCRATRVCWELAGRRREVSLQKSQGGRLERDGSRQLQQGDPMAMAGPGPCEGQYLNGRGGTEGEGEETVRPPGAPVGGLVLS